MPASKGVVSTKAIRTELKQLVGIEFFGTYDPEKSMTELDLREIEQVIIDRAPVWYALLQELLPNQRSNQAYYPELDMVKMRKRISIITYAVVHSIAARNASWILKALGVLLVTGSVKRRLIEVLNNMGLVCSYRTVQRLIVKNARAQIDAAKEMAKDEQTYLAYDNFNRQVLRKDQILSDVNEQVNMTTSFIARNPEIPATGLKKDMLKFETPLRAEDIIKNICSDDQSKATSLYHID